MKKNQRVIFEARYDLGNSMPLTTFLKNAANLSGRSLRRYFHHGLIELNRKKAHSNAQLKAGDQIRVFQAKESPDGLVREAEPIEVIYEDQELLVVNKPPGLPVHPSGTISSGTLANRVAHYFHQNRLALKVRPVNRLDYGTSGLILFAKSASSQADLSAAIQTHQIARIYYAVVQSSPSPPQGIINAPIGGTGKKRCVSSQGQTAITHYRTVTTYPQGTLLELTLETGRTHQIRVHLAHIGSPILGDPVYGVKTNLIRRPALHAGKLSFKRSRWTISDLYAELPDDLTHLIQALQTASKDTSES